MRQSRFFLPDERATQTLGAALAAAVTPGLTVYLHGDLGAGKTSLVRALLHAAGHGGHVKSPTYTLAEPYDIALQGQPAEAVHFDLYRMGSSEEFLDAGFRDYFNHRSVCLVEWPEKGEGVLPEPDIGIFLKASGQGREVELQALSDEGVACLDRLKYTSPT